MTTRQLTLATVLVALAAAGTLALAAPAPRVVSGGVTVDEFKTLNDEAKDFSMKLVMAAKGSGAYLADVDVTVKSLPQGEVVLQHRTAGPLMLAALPPGRYEVSATFADVRPGASKTIQRIVTVPHKGLAQAVLYFDTGDVVGDQSPSEYETH